VQEEADRGDILEPFQCVLDGRAVPYRDLVSAGRRIAHALVAQGWSVVLCGESHWAGVWNLEPTNRTVHGTWVGRAHSPISIRAWPAIAGARE
jgi:hypothetical protein